MINILKDTFEECNGFTKNVIFLTVTWNGHRGHACAFQMACLEEDISCRIE